MGQGDVLTACAVDRENRHGFYFFTQVDRRYEPGSEPSQEVKDNFHPAHADATMVFESTAAVDRVIADLTSIRELMEGAK